MPYSSTNRKPPIGVGVGNPLTPTSYAYDDPDNPCYKHYMVEKQKKVSKLLVRPKSGPQRAAAAQEYEKLGYVRKVLGNCALYILIDVVLVTSRAASKTFLASTSPSIWMIILPALFSMTLIFSSLSAKEDEKKRY